MLNFLRSMRSRVFKTFVLAGALTVLGADVSRSQPSPADAELQRLIVRYKAMIERHTGRPFTRPIKVTNERRYQEELLGLARAGVYARAMQVIRDPDTGRFVNVVGDGSVLADWGEACLIVATDRWTRMRELRDRQHIIAHELYHCAQREQVNMRRTIPDWLKEGSADWVGATLVGSNNVVEDRTRWPMYFTATVAIGRRSYDGAGLFAHLEHQGENVWQILDDLFGNLPFLLPEMFERLIDLTGDTESILQTWPMGLERNHGAGRDWDTTAPSGVPQRRAAVALPAPSPPQTLTAGVQYLYNLTIPSRKIVLLKVADGYGAIRWNRNTTRINPGFQRRYCVEDSCRCEDGSTPGEIDETVDTSDAVLALTGYLTAGRFWVSVEDPDCEPEEGTLGPGASGGGGRPHASSHGDPHINTFDGYRYSFQTVGEFLLSKSSDGRFELQARQSPIPGRQMSLNTAAAMRVGDHRVAVYSQGAPDGGTPLWIDGVATPLDQGTLALEQGGSVTFDGRSLYTVEWPTGEQVSLMVRSVSEASFLTITPWVSREHSGELMGLFGDLNGNRKDDLKTRSGQVIPSQDVYAPVTRLVNRVIDTPVPLSGVQNAFFKQLYRQFGDSWRVSVAESLFDYVPGQSTVTFTDRAFPSSFPTLFGVPLDEINEATRLCQDMGVGTQFIEGCVFDVAATGQRGFAESAANAVLEVLARDVEDRVKREVKDRLRDRFRKRKKPF